MRLGREKANKKYINQQVTAMGNWDELFWEAFEKLYDPYLRIVLLRGEEAREFVLHPPPHND